MTSTISLSYASGAVSDPNSPSRLDALVKLRGTTRQRSYTKTEESAWQKAHSKATTGQDSPLTFRDLSIKDRTARIQTLIKKGLGDGSIAVRLNKEGVACSRADVHRVRTGREAPDGQGSFDELSFNPPS